MRGGTTTTRFSMDYLDDCIKGRWFFSNSFLFVFGGFEGQLLPCVQHFAYV